MSAFDPAIWYRIASSADPIQQGDQLFDVTLRSIVRSRTRPGQWAIGVSRGNVIVATQSCDLDNRKVEQVEVVPVHSITRWLYYHPRLHGDLETIRRGNAPGLYLLPGWSDAGIIDARETRIIAFDEKLSLDWEQVDEALAQPRIHLRSPYIEHLAQALARFYMRIGLPENLPPIKWESLDYDTGGRGRTLSLGAAQCSVAGLPAPQERVSVRVQKYQLAGQFSVVYRAQIEGHGEYTGVGGSETDALNSLLQYVVARRNSTLEQLPISADKQPWLLVAFPVA